jgi:hypothetical protein
MKKNISASLLTFYRKVLEPQFRSIEEKLSEHDEKFRQIFDRFDILHRRLENLKKGFHSIALRMGQIGKPGGVRDEIL